MSTASNGQEEDARPLSLKQRIAALQQAAGTNQPKPPQPSSGAAHANTESNSNETGSGTLAVPDGASARTRSSSSASSSRPSAIMSLYGNGSGTLSPSKSRPATPTIAAEPESAEGTDELKAYPPISPNSSRSHSPVSSMKDNTFDPLGATGGANRARAGSTSALVANPPTSRLAATASGRDRAASTTAATSELRKLDLGRGGRVSTSQERERERGQVESPRDSSPGPTPPTIPSRPRFGANSSSSATGTQSSPPVRRTTLASSAEVSAASPTSAPAPRLPPRRSATQSSNASDSTIASALSTTSSQGPALPPRPRPKPPLAASLQPAQKTTSNATRSSPAPSINSVDARASKKSRPIDPRARKRYEQLWDKLQRLPVAPVAPPRPAWIKASDGERLPGHIVRAVWVKSGLGNDKLGRIWDAVAEPGGSEADSLSREGMLQGLWMIDEELRQRQR